MYKLTKVPIPSAACVKHAAKRVCNANLARFDNLSVIKFKNRTT